LNNLEYQEQLKAWWKYSYAAGGLFDGLLSTFLIFKFGFGALHWLFVA
jgi:hypothetical protein